VRKLVQRIEIGPDVVTIGLGRTALLEEIGEEPPFATEKDRAAVVLELPATLTRRGSERKIVIADRQPVKQEYV
jgi:hypothetical protein